MLYSGLLLLQSGALGKVPETFGDCWELPAAAQRRSRRSEFRWRWEKCRNAGGWDSPAARHRGRAHGSTSDVTALLASLLNSPAQPLRSDLHGLRPPNSSVSPSLPSIPSGPRYREKLRHTWQSPCCWKWHLFFCLPVAAQPVTATRFWGLGLLQLEFLIC